ncbi:MAG: recombinase family protein [Eubacteriales bacterium]
MDKIKLRKYFSQGKTIHDLPLRVVYYARVSTETDAQLNSLSNQTGYYEEYIKSHPAWTFGGGYIDEGITGTSASKRNGFLRMIDDARRGAFDYIVTKEISRFSRNTLDSIRYTRELCDCGVGVYFQNDNIDTMTSDAELRLTIMASIAQDEVRKLSERVRFGLRRAQEQGVVLGADNIFGYRKKDGVLTVDEAQASAVRRIFELYCEGRLGLRRIARELFDEGIHSPSGGEFTYGTLAGIIRNPKYKGTYAGHKYQTDDYRSSRILRVSGDEWITGDGAVPAIIEPELWERANVLLERRGEISRSHADLSQNRYRYSGKLICAEHGCAYHRHVVHGKAGDRECWNCRIYRLHGKAACDSPTIYSSELDDVLSDIWRSIAPRPRELADMLAGLLKGDTDGGGEQTERELEAVRRKKERLYELYADELIDKAEYKRRRAEYESSERELSGKLSSDGAAAERPAALNDAILRLCGGSGDNAFRSDAFCAALLKSICIKKEENGDITLDIRLDTGGGEEKLTSAVSRKTSGSISACERGISQAQVSRLEKGALEKIRKQF